MTRDSIIDLGIVAFLVAFVVFVIPAKIMEYRDAEALRGIIEPFEKHGVHVK